VLCKTVTGIATVRALAQCGVEVHACVFRRNDPVRYSRYAVKVPCYDLLDDEPALVRFLISYAAKFKSRPVLFPTGDAHALLLAKHSSELSPHYRIWQLPYGELGRIINKDRLYEAARGAGVRAERGEHVPDSGYHQVDTEQNTRYQQCLARPGQHDDTECHAEDADQEQQLPGVASELVQWTFENGLFANCHLNIMSRNRRKTMSVGTQFSIADR